MDDHNKAHFDQAFCLHLTLIYLFTFVVYSKPVPFSPLLLDVALLVAETSLPARIWKLHPFLQKYTRFALVDLKTANCTEERWMWCNTAQLPPATNTSKFCISTLGRVRMRV